MLGVEAHRDTICYETMRRIIDAQAVRDVSLAAFSAKARDQAH